MKRHTLDTEERIIFLSGNIEEDLLEKFKHGKLDFNKHYLLLSAKSEHLDELASKKYSESDLEDYSERMSIHILPQLTKLKNELTLQEDKRDNYKMIGLISYLMAELQRLMYTVENMPMEAGV